MGASLFRSVEIRNLHSPLQNQQFETGRSQIFTKYKDEKLLSHLSHFRDLLRNPTLQDLIFETWYFDTGNQKSDEN